MISKAVAMLDFESLARGPIPAVDPEHLRRWWLFQSENARPGVSFATRVISHVCESEEADPLAVWARAVLIFLLVEQGALAKDSVPDAVYENAAVFPLPHGLEKFDPDEFLKTLDQRRVLTS